MKRREAVRHYPSLPGILPLLVLTLALGGCSNSINLRTEAEVPKPLIAEIPLRVGVHFDEEFRNYLYEEDTEDRPDWRIDNSASRIALFEQVLSSMFSRVQSVGNIEAAGNNIDAIISPKVEEMQLALPQETYSDYYEAWIKYSIRLYTPDGELVTEWPVTGYGKSAKGFLSSRDKGLHSAIGMALRDVGAKLALGFPQASPVKQWLAAKTPCNDESVSLAC